MEQFRFIPPFFPTSEFSQLLGVKPETVRRSYSVNGHYMSIIPRKMPNGRLMWPKDKTFNLLEG